MMFAVMHTCDVIDLLVVLSLPNSFCVNVGQLCAQDNNARCHATIAASEYRACCEVLLCQLQWSSMQPTLETYALTLPAPCAD